MKPRTSRTQRAINAWIAAPEWMRIGGLIVVLIMVLLIAGCGHTVQIVKVPVPVQCEETIPERPVMPTEQFKSKPSLDQFIQAADAEIQRREGYEEKLRTALEACTAPIQP